MMVFLFFLSNNVTESDDHTKHFQNATVLSAGMSVLCNFVIALADTTISC